MSKTIGNVIDPVELTKKYGVDSLRYYLLAKFNPFTDGDFSEDRLKEVYNADLANGLGNLVSRVAKLCETSGFGFLKNPLLFYEETEKNLKEYRFDNALKFLWEVVGKTDNLIDKEKPWKLKDKKLKEVLKDLVQNVRLIAHNLKPFLPETADAIEKQFAGPKIKVKAPLFPRLR